MNVTQLAFSTLEFNRVHGVMHPDGWEHPLHLEASQLFVSILLRQGPVTCVAVVAACGSALFMTWFSLMTLRFVACFARMTLHLRNS
jgi:hypothetical protein